MYRLAVLIFILILTTAVGCRRERPGEAEEAVVDTTEVARADSVSQWIRQGETTAVKTPNRQACLYVPAEALVGLGDSVRISIHRRSQSPDALPPDLHPAFQGRKVFPPVYEFRAHDTADREFSEFADSLIVAMCVGYRSDLANEAEAFQRALLARPDPENPDSLQLFRWKDPPVQCELTAPDGKPCLARGNPASTQGAAANLGRWLTGAPVTPTPAHAAQTAFKGISGGGTGNSPFAAVDSLPGDNASQSSREGGRR